MDDEPTVGRPTLYKPEYAEQVRKLTQLGATDREVADFMARDPSENEWLAQCLGLIRQDRLGLIAARKRVRADFRRRKRRSDPSFRVVESMRARMSAALKGRTDGMLFSRLGYSVEELIAHLERRFSAGMSWANYGKWHIDHIRPCAAFDQTDPVQFDACWALSNLQPLWASDNIRKGAKYVAP